MTIVNSEDELRKDPAWRLLNYKHRVRVPRYATIDPDFEDKFGTPTYDLERPNEAMDMFVTIEHLLTYYVNGAVPRFLDHERARMIVEDIQELINNWHREIMQGVDVCDPPMEYLNLLEEFSTAIYPQARISKAIDIRSDNIQMTALERFMSQRRKLDQAGVEGRVNSLPTEAPTAMSIVSGNHAKRFKE